MVTFRLPHWVAKHGVSELRERFTKYILDRFSGAYVVQVEQMLKELEMCRHSVQCAHLQKFPISPMHHHHKRDKRNAHIESEREREREWKRACGGACAVFVLVSSR